MTLTGSGGAPGTPGFGNLNLGGYAVTLSGALSGSGGLNLLGPGTLVLSGSDNYTGGTDVVAGTLIVGNDYSLPNGGSLIVGAGGEFVFDPVAAAAGTMYSRSPNASMATGSTLSTVPEPGTLTLLLAGLVLGSGIVWRKCRRNSSEGFQLGRRA